MITIVPYNEKYEKGMQILYSIPITGLISLALERQPHSMFGAHIQTEEPRIFLAIDQKNDKVLAIFNVGTRRHYYQGKIQSFPYFCDLRIHTDYQKSSILLRIIRFYRQLEIDLNIVPALTVVFADNKPMIKMIEKRANSSRPTIVPFYQKIADIETFIFRKVPYKWKIRRNFSIRKATLDDINQMQDLQERNVHDLMIYQQFDKIKKNAYYHGLDISDFHLLFENKVLVGLMGGWKTSGFKQTRIHKYHWTINFFRPLYNLTAKVFKLPILPKTDGTLNTLQIHNIIIEKRRIDIFQALVKSFMDDTNLPLMLSLDIKDPLYASFYSFRSVIRKKGHVYFITESKKRKAPEWIPIDVVRI